MTDKILVVSDPDDIWEDGFRLLAVDLDKNQREIISSNVLTLVKTKIILYTWTNSENVAWVIEKKHKSNLIFFNAESINQTLVGYLAAQPNSYYFGTLRDLNIVNTNVILDGESSMNVINNYLGNYERKFK